MTDIMHVRVAAEQQTYAVVTGWDVVAELGRLMTENGPDGRRFLFLDSGVDDLYGPLLTRALAEGRAEETIPRYVVPAGEQHKTLDEVARAYGWLAEHRAERRDVIVVAGGGKAGDLVGLVAATYLRGMRLVQVPTTLLAQVDSSLGGKVGVDLQAGKNLVGAFHHPSLVVADLTFLRSLPRRELAAGYAEAIKHGLIGDVGLFDIFEKAGAALLDLDAELTEQVVPRAMAVKVDVVQEDVREAGRRAILNYGHSIGHALEVVTGYRVFLHGEAVAFGMVAAAELSCRMGMLDRTVANRQNRVLRDVELLGVLPTIDEDAVLNALGYDKKVHAGRLRWVLLKGAGNPVVTADVPQEIVRAVVHDLLAGHLGGM